MTTTLSLRADAGAAGDAARSGRRARRAAGADTPADVTRCSLILVGAQVALAIVLLVGAGLLIRSFVRMQECLAGLDAAITS